MQGPLGRVVLIAMMVGCGAPAPVARSTNVAAPPLTPRIPPEQVELSPAHRQQLEDARTNRRVFREHAVQIGSETLVLFLDTYAGPSPVEYVTDVGVEEIHFVDPPPPGGPYTEYVIGVARLAEDGAEAEILVEQAAEHLRYDWWLYDLEHDGSRELVVRVTTWQQGARLWGAGAWDGAARLRLDVAVLAQGSSEACGPAFTSAGEPRIVDGALELPYHRRVYTGECSEALDPGFPICECRGEQRDVTLQRGPDGMFVAGADFDANGDGPFEPPPPDPR